MQFKEEILTSVAAHLVYEKDGIYRCMEPDFEVFLNVFLNRYKDIHSIEKQGTELTPEAYPLLPENNRNDPELNFRRKSLKIVEQILKGKSNQLILEVGSWNGWLSHHLSSMGNELIATDYFDDEINGLSAKKFYPNTWTSLQMDLSKPDIFRENIFDCIIINHALQFFEHPLEYIKNLKHRVKKDGIILIIGLPVFRSTQKKEKAIEAFKRHYKQKYDFDIFLRPTKAFFDWHDKEQMETNGLIFYPYKEMLGRNLLSKIAQYKPAYFYAMWNNA